MLLVTLAGFCFCFVLAAAARWNDVDVIVNPTTGCEALSLANGGGASAEHTLHGDNFCYCCHADQEKTYRKKIPIELYLNPLVLSPMDN